MFAFKNLLQLICTMKNICLFVSAAPLCHTCFDLEGHYPGFDPLFWCLCLLHYLNSLQPVLEKHWGFHQKQQVATKTPFWYQRLSLEQLKHQNKKGSKASDHNMSVFLSSKTHPITTRPKADGSGPPRALSNGGIPRSIGSQGKHDEAIGAEKNKERILNLGECIPSSVSMSPTDLGVLGPTLTLKAFEDLGRRDPLPASLASLVACFDCLCSSSVVWRADKS